MALPSITSKFAGERNQGSQIGYNGGSIENNYYLTPTNAALTTLSAERSETPPQPSCFVPFRRDPDFVDRPTLLDQICNRCSAAASRVALVGVGGVGKSQLAIEYCYRTAERSPETWVLWAHASNTARLEQSFREIADIVKVREHRDPQADVFKLVHDWLRDERNGPWLLVLDNADDPTVLSPRPRGSQGLQAGNDSGGNNGGSSDDLQQYLLRYLPPTRHGSVLVTSRTRRAAMEVVEDSDIILIEPMDNAAACALLHKKLGDNGDKAGKDDSIVELAAALDHMPLALVQAATYIRRRVPRCSVQQYLEEYCQSDSKKMSLLNKVGGHLRRDEAASNVILITWQISFDHIRSTKQSAADLLSIMSFFDRQGIPERLLHSQSSAVSEHVPAVSIDDGFEDDILMLRDYSFVTATADEKIFEMHSLVQLATRKWLESQGQLDKWREQLISNLCAELPRAEYKNWATCQALFPHAKAALAQRPTGRRSLEEWALLLYNAARYAGQRGRAYEAEYMSVASMGVRREALGEKSVETLNSMDMLGVARMLGGKYEESKAIHRQTLAIREKVLGCEHPDTLMSMNNLALVLGSQGRHEDAEAMHRQTLAIREKVLGREHPDTLASINNLVLVLCNQGKNENAETMYRQTLAAREKVLGREYPGTLASMNNLALVLNNQGKHQNAEAMHRQTLATREKVLGREHPDTLASMNNLALALNNQGKYQKAEAMHRQTLATREKVLGREHPDTLASMNNLALALNNQGKYQSAETMHRQTLATREKVLGREHPGTLASMNNLAEVLNRHGKCEDAEEIYRQTLATREKVLGREHPNTLRSMNSLALVLGKQGKYEDAEEMHRQTLATREKVLGREHPDTLVSVYCLACMLANQCRYDESLALFDRACAAYSVVLGDDHPNTRGCYQKRSETLALQKQSGLVGWLVGWY